MEQARWRLDLGARPIDDDRVRFRVWAARAESISIRIEGLPEPVPMTPQPLGYYETDVSGIGAGARYRYILNGQKDCPDPASRYQPEGVHGPSCVVDPDGFPWTDRQWAGLPLSRLIIYELHVG